MPAKRVSASLALAVVLASLASHWSVAERDGESTAEYFALLRQYLGDNGFERHRCLVEQEQHGWQSNRLPPFKPFSLGVEGSGHHAMQTLLKGGRASFPTITGDGGAFSVPTGWRVLHQRTNPYSHPDIKGLVDHGDLIIVLLRYAPSALMSSVNRFQNRSEEGHQKRVTGVDELFTLHDSLAYVDAVMRFPDFDCGRLIVIPFELLTQRPMSLQGPLTQALQLKGVAAGTRLRVRLQAIAAHEAELAASSRTRYFLKEQVCTELGLSALGPPTAAAHNGMEQAVARLRKEPGFLKKPCADRAYALAKAYFDGRRFMFQDSAPAQTFVDASARLNPGAALSFDAYAAEHA